jgi:glycerate-2-kinase
VKEVTRVLQIEKGMITRSLSNVRNAVDQLKGGRITRMLYPARMFHILTIDCNGSTMIPGYEGLVAGNTWLHTLPVVTTAERALQVIRQHDAENSLPPEIMEYMKNMTPAQDCLRREEFEKMNFRIFGVMPEHLTHLPSAVAVAKELGYATHVISKGWFMEAREMGKFIAHMAKLIHAEEEPFTTPCALFAIGEMVVTVGKGSGVGGRNQELVIAAAKEISGCDRIVIGSVDTDGTDGPGGGFDDEATSQGVSALAGGIVDGYSAEEAARLGYELVDVLKLHGTSKPLWDMGDGIWTTQSISVQDLTVVLVESK